MKKKFIIKLMQTTPAMLAICLAGAFSANATTYDISANVGGADPSVYTTPVNLNTAQWNTWVKTGFNVIAGDTLVITAAGTWTIDNGNPSAPWKAEPITSWNGAASGWDYSAVAGPNGLAGSPWTSDNYVSGVNQGSLIAYVGSTPAAPGSGYGAVSSGTDGYYAIGSSATITWGAAARFGSVSMMTKDRGTLSTIRAPCPSPRQSSPPR